MTAPVSPASKRILVGEIMGAFGVRGEVKIRSHTAPETAIFRYQPWLLRDAHGGERVLEGVRGRSGAKGVVVTLPGVEGRDAAEALARLAQPSLVGHDSRSLGQQRFNDDVAEGLVGHRRNQGDICDRSQGCDILPEAVQSDCLLQPGRRDRLAQLGLEPLVTRKD